MCHARSQVRAGPPVRTRRFEAIFAYLQARRPPLAPCRPSAATHAASTRPPAARASPCPACRQPGRPRTARAGSAISNHLTPPSPRVAGTVSIRGSILCLSSRCAPAAGPNPAPLAPPTPRAAPHGCGSLEPASAAAPALFAAARAALTRFCACVRAGSILGKARTEEAAPHRLRRPEDPATARRRLPPHHTHSLPFSHHSHHHLHPSSPPQLHPPPPLAPLVIPPPQPPAGPRARPYAGPLSVW